MGHSSSKRRFHVVRAAAVSFAVIVAACGGTPVYRDPSAPVDRRVADLLGRMTIEEKVAQMMAIWQQKKQLVDGDGKFDPAKAAALLAHGAGQITRPTDGLERKDRRRSPRETVELVNAIQRWVLEHTRLGIPIMFHEEALHGLAALRGTHFPVPIALGSTWNPGLVERVFTVAGREARARGVQQVLSPVLDLARDPRWGRTEETYGEDPHLVSEMGLAAIRGYQGPMPGLTPGRVFATAKHFAGHGPHEGGINTAPTTASPRDLHEALLWPFERAVREGRVSAIMPSYNEVDGIPSTANRFLLDRLLRREWGFEGLVVSDYFGIEQLVQRHHLTDSLAEAARLALAAGVDLELPDGKGYKTLVDEVRAGRIPPSQIDRAAGRVLRLKFLAGLFEHPYADADEAERVTNNADARSVALEAARASIVLLRNESGTLPLGSAVRTLAVVGPNAADVHLGTYSENPERGVSVLQGIRDRARGVTVVHAEGPRITENAAGENTDAVAAGDPTKNRQRIEEAVSVARAADAIVAVVGTTEATSREAWGDKHLGDAASLDPTGQQDDFVDALAATGKPVIVVLVNGRPLSVARMAGKAAAILEMWYGGQEGGTALAEALFGDVNPGGKLPITVPRSAGQLPVYYNRKPTSFRDYLFESRSPLFPFGFGMSYTTFRLDDLRLAAARIGRGDRTTMSVRVTNTGSRAGDEVIQMYVHQVAASVTRPVKQLRGFSRVSLAPGASTTVTLPIGPEALWLVDQQMERRVEPGAFEILVGTSSETALKAILEVR